MWVIKFVAIQWNVKAGLAGMDMFKHVLAWHVWGGGAENISFDGLF